MPATPSKLHSISDTFGAAVFIYRDDALTIESMATAAFVATLADVVRNRDVIWFVGLDSMAQYYVAKTGDTITGLTRINILGSGIGEPTNTSVPLIGNGVLSDIAFAHLPTTQLVGALNAADALAYDGGALPADGASVTFLKGRALTFADGVQFPGKTAPTFDLDAGGTHYHGLRFSGAEALAWPGIVSRYASADMGVTLIAVFRFAAVPTSMQTILGLNVDGSFQPYRQTIRLKADASGFYFNAQTGSGTDIYSAAIASAPQANTTYIAIGRHGTPSGDNFNKLAVRISASTSTDTDDTTQDLDFNSTGAMTQAFLGAVRRGGTFSEHLNGWVHAGYAYDRELSDTEVTAAIATLRADWGVS